MKEKVLSFCKRYYLQIVFLVVFLMLLGFFALPYLNLIVKYKVDGEKVKLSIGTYNLYQLIGGFNLTYSKLTDPVTFAPSAAGIIVLLGLIIAVVCVVISAVVKEKASLVLRLVSFGALIVSTVLLCGYDSLYLNINSGSLGLASALGTIGIDFDIKFMNEGLITVLLSFIVLLVVLLGNCMKEINFEVKEIVEIAMLVAAALVLDKVVLWKAPTGGSINLAGIALLILCVRWGAVKGFIGCSITFGLISCIFDGYGINTFPFDYLIGFSGYAAAGIASTVFRNTVLKKHDDSKHQMICLTSSLLIGAVSVMITRLIGSGISSNLYYGLTDLGENILYNIAYVGPSAALSFVACVVLAPAIYVINKRYPTKKVTTEEVAK